MRLEKKLKRLNARKARIRKKIRGDAARPRVSVYLSNRNIIAQIIDDQAGKTLVSVSTLDKDSEQKGKNRRLARKVGAALSEKALEMGIKTVVFDRNGRQYHGRVKDLADAMREKGLTL